MHIISTGLQLSKRSASASMAVKRWD